jgi:hypothetical protein
VTEVLEAVPLRSPRRQRQNRILAKIDGTGVNLNFINLPQATHPVGKDILVSGAQTPEILCARLRRD